jgi:hypothetical protein
MTNNLKATGPRIEAEGVVDGEIKLRLWFSRKKGREEWESLNKEGEFLYIGSVCWLFWSLRDQLNETMLLFAQRLAGYVPLTVSLRLALESEESNGGGGSERAASYHH